MICRFFPKHAAFAGFSVAALLSPAFCRHSLGQTNQVETSSERPVSSPADDELEYARRLLGDIRDHVFSFDHPAFYRFRNYVKNDPDERKYDISDHEAGVAWSFLLERPSDYRGELVVVEGKLLKRHPEYTLPESRGSGVWYQYELGQAGTRAICTVIATEETEKFPIRSRVRAKGYFIMVRAFKTDSGEAGSGPLIVARRLESVQGPASEAAHSEDAFAWLIGGTAVLAIVWLVMRRGLRTSRSESSPAFGKPGQKGDSEDDFDWLTKDGEGNES